MPRETVATLKSALDSRVLEEATMDYLYLIQPSQSSGHDKHVTLRGLFATYFLVFIESWRCQQLYLLCRPTRPRQDPVYRRYTPIFTDRNILILLLSMLTSTGGIGRSGISFREVGREMMGPTEPATNLS